ncbi:MAG: recombination-associated protein RdgC [Desulfosoma sp.]
MGLQGGTITFTSFHLPDPSVADFWSFVDESLKEGAYRTGLQEEETAKGFARWEDLFDATFPFGCYRKGEYVAFQFRWDQLKVPPLVLKQYEREAVQAYRAEHDGKYPPRHERLKIREEVQNQLLERVLPQPSGCDVVWSPAQHRLLVGTASLKMLEAFLEHFERIFTLHPIPLYHVQWALHGLSLPERLKDVLSGLVSVKSPHALQEGRFLGYEFLTWLWYLAETREGRIPLEKGAFATLALGERVVLSRQDDGKERVICTTQAGALDEARTALRQGKMVEEAQWILMAGDNEYSFTLDRDLWTLKGLKTPKQIPRGEEEDPDGRFLEKMFFIDEVLGILNAAYREFLTARLSSTWASDVLPSLKRWIDGGAPDSLISGYHDLA